METINFPAAEFIRFVIVLTRLGGVMIGAPFFSGTSIPKTIRVIFTLFAALVMTPALPLSALPAGISLASMTGTLVIELLFGFTIGFVANCVFAGLQFAGQIISFQMGFSLINLIDPQTQVNMPVFSFLLNYMGLLMFLMINGHHWFLLAIYESFKTMPVGGFALHGPLLEQLIGFTVAIFSIGVKIAGPIIIVTILIDVVMGVIGRTAPQLHLFIIGMPVKMLAGFACLSFSFYFMPRFLEKLFLSLSRTLAALAGTGT